MNVKRLFRGFVTTLIMTVLCAGTAFAEFSAETETAHNEIGIGQWPKDSHLKGGETLNSMFKSLSSGASSNEDTVNNSITAIRFASSAPDGSVVTQEVQSSGAPVYAWFDDGTIYLYSEAEKIYASSSMIYMCSNMKALTDISALKEIDMSESSVLTGMFKNCTSLTDLTPLSSWNTSNFYNISALFYGCSALSDVSPIKDWDMSHLGAKAGTGQVFCGCSSLGDASCLSTHEVNGYVAWNLPQRTISGSLSSTLVEQHYKSDHSNLSGYPNWYLSEIMFMSDGLEYATVQRPLSPWFYEDMMPDTPTKSGYVFEGWNTAETGDGKMLTFSSGGDCTSPADVYYAVWKEKQDATLLDGKSLHTILASYPLASGETSVKAIRHAVSPPEANVQTRQIQETGEEVLAWFDGTTSTIYWYSDAETVYANEDMHRAFINFQYLTDLSGLSDWDMRNVTTLEAAFFDCTNLKDISPLAGWNTENVTTMNSMFGYCTWLSDVSALGSWDTRNVLTMNQMFQRCTHLSDLTGLDGWNTESVAELRETFDYCTKLSDVSALGSWNTGNVASLYRTFSSCDSLENLRALSSWNTKNVTDMQETFLSCDILTDVSPLAGWNTENVTTLANLFYYCHRLTDASSLSGWNTDNVTTGKTSDRESAFYESGISDPSKYPTWYSGYSAVSPAALTLDGNGGTVFGEPVITIMPETESEADTEPESLSAEYGIDPVMLDDEMVLPDIVLIDDAAYGEPEEDVMVASPPVATPSVASASDALRDNILVLPEAEREGFMFLGWSDEEDGEVVYEAGDEIVIDGEMVLYAVWSEEPAIATPSNASRSDEPGDAGATSDLDVTEATPSEASRADEDEEEIPSSRPDPEPDPEPVPIEVATPSEPKRETDASESDPADGEPIEPNNTNE